MRYNSQRKLITGWAAVSIVGTIALAGAIPAPALAVQDVMLQTVSGKVVTGVVDDQTAVGTLGTRVYPGQFLSNFLASNPGFFGFRTGDANIAAGASGFPANHDVNFDLLPMTVYSNSSNLFYWDGSNANGGVFDMSDVSFLVPSGLTWSVLDDNSSWFSVNANDHFVPGGVIDRTSADVWPDGIDSGSIHNHMALQLSDNDGNSGTSPPAGVYMISWHARSAGFDTSDPSFFVFRTSTITNAVRDLAVAWVNANIPMLTSPPGDYNRNGDVDAADYILWRRTSGQFGSNLAADGNGNGQIDAGDFTVWRNNFGKTLPASGAGGGLSFVVVPEPVRLAINDYFHSDREALPTLGTAQIFSALVPRTNSILLCRTQSSRYAQCVRSSGFYPIFLALKRLCGLGRYGICLTRLEPLFTMNFEPF